jgi:predicted esterase
MIRIRYPYGLAGLAVAFLLAGCQVDKWFGAAPSPTPASTSTPLPTLSLPDTSMTELTISDFDAFHSTVGGDANKRLIFGNVSISKPAADLPPELAAFLGRWEGVSFGPPVKKDWKFVFVVQEITAQGGKASLWAGTNLQYPGWVMDVKFRVVPGANPSIEWAYDNGKSVITIAYDAAKKLLRGWLKSADYNNYPWGPIDLYQTQSYFVYKDYPQYLAGLHIAAKAFADTTLQRFGAGYLAYLPEGYESNPEKNWPLLVFLHGSGDRGDNLFLLAKASPLMMIREKGPLPFIIIAPLLNASKDYASFPDAYMDGVLKEVLAGYRVDPDRIYLTGLSMGGEATYRFALNHPTTFAAIAPLAAFNPKYLPASGIPPFSQPMERIKLVPVWAIHGADDMNVPLAAARNTVADLEAVGGNVLFSVLENHDHDVWTDTYLDPKFYAWFLQYTKPAASG